MPATSEVVEFPLPPTISEAPPSVFVGPGPWQIKLGPDGNVYFNEFFDGTVARFDVGRLGDPACLKLTPEGENPCILDLVVPGLDLKNEQVHSIDFDARGNLWFTIHTADEPDSAGSLGFVSGKFRHVVRLPSLAAFPGTGGASVAGVAVDRTSGDVWFAEFWRKRVGRLRPIPEL